MKKILPLIVVGIFVLSGLGAGVSAVKEESKDNEVNNSERATHTVLGEYGTSTTCQYCRYAHGALKELYAEGQLDFYYITYVCNMNSIAYSYCVSHYNLYGYPTIWWDGGRDVDVGAGSIPGAKSTYTSSINSLSSQPVKDVVIDLTVTWLGGTNMQVDCTVTNNEGSTYGGTIQVAICEKVSSRGWVDTGGQTYTMTFLDWAFKDPLSISSGGSWSDSMTWDGTSHGYPTVTQGNTIVIAAAYNDEWHQGYSYPPSSNPFDAYYLDECVAVEAGGSSNDPPGTPSITGTTNGKVGTPYTYTFNSVDPNDDDLEYYIKWGDGHVEMWEGPYASGVDANIAHTYSQEKTFNIEAKARDTIGAESDWATFQVTIPRSKTINSVLLRLFQNYPSIYQVIQQLLGL